MKCVHQIEMSLFLPFRNVTLAGTGRARSLAERSADRAGQIWRSSIVARVLTIIGTRESRGLAFHPPYFASSALWRASELLVPFANISLNSGTGLVDGFVTAVGDDRARYPTEHTLDYVEE